MKFKNPLKDDPFLRTSLTWALGIAGMNMAILFSMLQLTTTYDERVANFVPFLFVLFGAAYMVRFIGRRPVYYCAIFGFTVGACFALLGLARELLQFQGVYYESFVRFGLVAVVRGIPLALVGALGGWVVTRGRVPIEIEMPTKKDEDAARQAGLQQPAPRIVTPLAAMPGSQETNAALLERLEKDPESLMSEREQQKLAKANARAARQK